MDEGLFSVQVTIKKAEWLDDPKARWNHGLVMAGKQWKYENKHNPTKSGSTGNMARKSTYKITARGKTIQFISTFYWIFLMKGTGIYGPTGQPIRPVHARALAWSSTGGGMLQVSSAISIRRTGIAHTRSRDVYLNFAMSVKGVFWPGRLDEIKQALKDAFREGIRNNASSDE